MSRWLRQVLMDKQGAGDEGGSGGGAGAAGAGADAGTAGSAGDAGAGGAGDKGAAGAAGEGDKGAAGDKGGAAGAGDWRAAIAGQDAALLETLKGIEDPKALIDAHQGQVKWRESIAGDNKDALKTLERFASPKALWDSYDALRGRMAKGELKSTAAFPEKGTDEQKAAWRAEHGVPADGKYEIKLPGGAEIDETFKPGIESFTKFAHAKNLPQEVVNETVNWYIANEVARAEQAAERFEQQRTDTAAELGKEWGSEYKPNLNKIQGVIDSTIPADQKELKELVNRAIATNAHFARHYAAIALQLNPAGTLVPGDRGANEGTITDELKKIEKTMRENRRDYDKDEGMQKRYRDLIDAYGKLTGKDWGR